LQPRQPFDFATRRFTLKDSRTNADDFMAGRSQPGPLPPWGKNCRAARSFFPLLPRPPAVTGRNRARRAAARLERVLRYSGAMNIRDYLFGGLTRQTVYKGLDAAALRGRAIAENLANVDTPGYQRKEVNFEEQLQKALEKKLPGVTTQAEHFPFGMGVDISKVQPFVFAPSDPTKPGEVNNVDIDIENAKLAENQILFNYAIKFAGFDKFNAAILGRAG
jgi:flagellar basal-body rod protein FlgB